MGENESGSPWDELAQELGVEPSAESSERSQPPPTEIPAASTSDDADLAEPPRQSPSDWNALADSLGIEVTEPEPVEGHPTEEVHPTEFVELSADDSRSDEETASLEESEYDGSTDDPLPPLPSEVDQIMSDSDWGGDDNETTDDVSDEEEGTSISGGSRPQRF